MIYLVSCESANNGKVFDKLRKARKYLKTMDKQGETPVIIRMSDGKTVKYSYSFAKKYR